MLVFGLLWCFGNVCGIYLYGLLENLVYLEYFLCWVDLLVLVCLDLFDVCFDVIVV